MSYGYGQPQPFIAAPHTGYPVQGYAGRRSAPPGVHVVAILQYLGGLLLLGVAFFAGVSPPSAGAEDFVNRQDLLRPEDGRLALAVAAGLVAFFGLITIVLARKLQRGRQWARVLMLIGCVLSIGTVAYALVTDAGNASGLGLVAPVLYVVLLNTPAARSWFRSHDW